MGVGNVLLKGLDSGTLEVVAQDIELLETCSIAMPGEFRYSVGYADCSIWLTCDRCGKQKCVACHGQFLVDLSDTKTTTCMACLGRTIFEVLQDAFWSGTISANGHVPRCR